MKSPLQMRWYIFRHEHGDPDVNTDNVIVIPFFNGLKATFLQEGVSLEAEIDGSPIMFPLSPSPN